MRRRHLPQAENPVNCKEVSSLFSYLKLTIPFHKLCRPKWKPIEHQRHCFYTVKGHSAIREAPVGAATLFLPTFKKCG